MSFSSEPSSRPASTLPRQDTATTMSSFSTSCSNLDTADSNSNTSSLRRHKTKPNRKRKKSVEHFVAFGDEKTLRTLKVHYYPEGNWGWIVLIVGVTVQAFSHGLHTSYGMLHVKLLSTFGSTPMYSGEYRDSFFGAKLNRHTPRTLDMLIEFKQFFWVCISASDRGISVHAFCILICFCKVDHLLDIIWKSPDWAWSRFQFWLLSLDSATWP